MSLSTTFLSDNGSSSPTTKRSVVMRGFTGQPGPATRRNNAAVPLALGELIVGMSAGAVLPEPLLSCILLGAASPVADAPSGRNGRGGANRNPCPNRTS